VARRTQLRDYRIEPGHLDDFVIAWTAGVLPLRERFGFTVDAAWTVGAESRFVWLLTYVGEESFEVADAAYYGSPERAAVDPDPADWIVAGDASDVELVELDRVGGELERGGRELDRGGDPVSGGGNAP
jgi:hypothetical protein